MSLVSSAVARACTRTGVRVLASGALAIGLLTAAPLTTAQGAPTSTATKAGAPLTKRVTKRAATRARKPSRVQVALRTALAQRGDRYAYGAAGPNRFDCSGLTYYSFRRAGFGGMPRTSSAQARFARKIKRDRMRRGDLVFFTSRGRVYHVGVYTGRKHGRRQIVHAPSTGTRVRTDAIWSNAWFPGTVRNR